MFAALSEGKYDTRPSADEVATAIREAGSLGVTGVERKEVRQEPPLLYDLYHLAKKTRTSSTVFSADKTLSIAQDLYERRVLSYPRTGSRYISADVFEEIPHFIMLRSNPLFGRYIDNRFDTTLNTRPAWMIPKLPTTMR